MKFVIDTSILIDALRGGIKWEKFLVSLSEAVQLHIPTIVIFELFSGSSTKEPKVYQKVADIIKYLQRVELTEEIAIRAGELFRDVNKTLQVPDYIVAASALEIGGIVVTLNKKHFQAIPGIKIYPLE